VVTIAMVPGGLDSGSGSEAPAPEAASAEQSSGDDGDNDGAVGPILEEVHATLPTTSDAAVGAAVNAAIGAVGGKKFGPITLPPGGLQLPNMTALREGVKAQLAQAVRDAVLHSVSVRPMLCPDGRPKVHCSGKDACAGKPCGAAQVCVPECGSCTERKCVNFTLPFGIPTVPKLPNLPLPKLPRVGMPRPPCANNEAMNLVATLKTVPATLMMSQSKQISIQCSPCPNGTVSRQPAVACTLCLPGTYADRSLSMCRRCLKGYYTSTAGAAACSACPANTFAPVFGSFACIPCPIGFTTNGKKAQSSCAFAGHGKTAAVAAVAAAAVAEPNGTVSAEAN
jgi:hypothetical protein